MASRSTLMVTAWVVTAVAVLALAPNLTRLAAESFGSLLPDEAESMVATRLIRETWPDRSQNSVLIAILNRDDEAGLTAADKEFASEIARRFERAQRDRDPGADDDSRSRGSAGGRTSRREITRVLGPNSDPEIAQRLVSKDGRTQLVLAGLDADWVAPRADESARRLKSVVADLEPPAGLSLSWSGDAAVGSAYMDAVHTTLDRASILVVGLLLVILIVVYRSLTLALVPLLTIGLSLLIARGLIASMSVMFHLDPNPLVELFLVAVLFGSGTDLVLLLTWRFAEHWDGVSDPEAMVLATRRHEALAILSSAGTLILALFLLGFSRFKLFNQTGPCVAIGMTVSLIASLTLAPALLVLLAKHRPNAFSGFRRPSSGFWSKIGRQAMSRPMVGWLAGLTLLAIPAWHALSVETTYDMVGELPRDTPALIGLETISRQFGPGEVSPLSVVIKSESDWRESNGLYLVDQLSREIDMHEQFGEIRSATQPLGSRDTFRPARLDSRLAAIRDGLTQIESGATMMASNFAEEAARLRIAMGFESLTGIKLPGLGGRPKPNGEANANGNADADANANALRPRQLLEKLSQAGRGAKLIAEGTARATQEMSVVLGDPVGVDALDRLLLTRQNLAENPDFNRAFAEYVSADGKSTRINIGMTARLHSREALRTADELLERAENFNSDYKNRYIKLWVTGPNQVMADVRRITNEDMNWALVLLPLGIFLAMLVMLRDFGICLNLVLTMLLTYFFTIGVTDWVFTWIGGTSGLDWKVKFFSFVILMACGVDYNIFLVSRMKEEIQVAGLHVGVARSIGHTGGLISSAAAITICSYLAFLASPLDSLRALGFAVALGIAVDAALVRTVIMPCGFWLMFHRYEQLGRSLARVESRSGEPAQSGILEDE